MDRGDRDVAVGDGVEIGAGAGVLGGAGRADPPDLAAARIALRDARLGAVAMAMTAKAAMTTAARTGAAFGLVRETTHTGAISSA